MTSVAVVIATLVIVSAPSAAYGFMRASGDSGGGGASAVVTDAVRATLGGASDDSGDAARVTVRRWPRRWREGGDDGRARAVRARMVRRGVRRDAERDGALMVLHNGEHFCNGCELDARFPARFTERAFVDV